jgi:hypothetical protein
LEIAVIYIRGILSGVTALFLALCVPGLVHAFKGISQEKATGLAVLAGGLTEAIFSPLFWIVAGGLFALFFAAGRLNSRVLRVLLFWIPTVFISILIVAVMGLVTYLYFRFRQG